MVARWSGEGEPLPLIAEECEFPPPPKPPEVPTGIPDPGSFRVSYDGLDGYWHDDPDSPFMYREDYQPARYYYDGWLRKPLTMRPVRSRQRRKRIETWTENGFPVGRWDWEFRATP